MKIFFSPDISTYQYRKRVNLRLHVFDIRVIGISAAPGQYIIQAAHTISRQFLLFAWRNKKFARTSIKNSKSYAGFQKINKKLRVSCEFTKADLRRAPVVTQTKIKPAAGVISYVGGARWIAQTPE